MISLDNVQHELAEERARQGGIEFLGIDPVNPLHGIHDEPQFDLVEFRDDDLARFERDFRDDAQMLPEIHQREHFSANGRDSDHGCRSVRNGTAPRPPENLTGLVHIYRKGLLSEKENNNLPFVRSDLSCDLFHFFHGPGPPSKYFRYSSSHYNS